MKPDPFTDALVRLLHCYHPSGLNNYDPGYKESEEGQRLTRLMLAHVQSAPSWRVFVWRVRQLFPGCSVWDTTVPRHDPCHSIRVALPGSIADQPRYDCVVALLSQLAPVYALYASHRDSSGPEVKGWTGLPPFPPEYQAHEAKLAELIESTFGFTRLSNDTLLTPVPDLVPNSANLMLGEARLIDCLFTNHRW
ncbi:hypothetical protein [Archangium sp.]|uniref:hypothetical protein n=1 Tax=Archangium sp. TaxID=1872627 RepID=UPI00286CB023|nr:hypothetical protein [Archangium sp.]